MKEVSGKERGGGGGGLTEDFLLESQNLAVWGRRAAGGEGGRAPSSPSLPSLTWVLQSGACASSCFQRRETKDRSGAGAGPGPRACPTCVCQAAWSCCPRWMGSEPWPRKALCLLGGESWVAPGSVGGDKVPPCPTPRLQTQIHWLTLAALWPLLTGAPFTPKGCQPGPSR